MTTLRIRALALAFALSIALPNSSEARVVKFVVESQTPFLGGAAWGHVGPYEKLVGTAYMEVDPNDPLNAVIVDLDLAPRNERGMVEFSSRFFILKPTELSRSNHKIYYTINNRGNDALYVAETAAQVGANEFYLRMGYIIADAGWQGDLAPVPTRLVPNFPIARQLDGSAIVGLMRVEYSDRNLPLAGTYSVNLEGNPAFRSYETADTDPSHSILTARDDVNAPKTKIPSDRWAFGRCPGGAASFVPSTFDICYFDGFQANKIYELLYPAKNPIVMGLGHAVTRDVGSFLRYELADTDGRANPVGPTSGHPGIRRMYGTGASQTGGYVRDFIYLGFNEDESRRKVFDGMLPTIAGTDRVFINVRFADPNIWSDQDDRHDFLQSTYPPTTYAITTDPISGVRDGVMKRPATDPLVMQTDSETEFWQLRASLNVLDGAGNPVPLPRNVRLYFNSSTGHGMTVTGLLTNAPGSRPICVHATPGGSVTETAKAVLVAMDGWADQGIEPPPSNYPRLEDGTLIPLEEATSRFPRIPGVEFPTLMNELQLLNFGPLFGRLGGVLTVQPPLLGPSYKLYVPRSDQDGLNLAGVRPIQIRVPLGTSTGWNVRAPAFRAPNLCGLSGAYFPFAQTRADRLAAGDVRQSLEERYKNHDNFVKAVEKAARDLVKERFLLPDDAERFISAAEASNVLR
jgi:hypothetical protein